MMTPSLRRKNLKIHVSINANSRSHPERAIMIYLKNKKKMTTPFHVYIVASLICTNMMYYNYRSSSDSPVFKNSYRVSSSLTCSRTVSINSLFKYGGTGLLYAPNIFSAPARICSFVTFSS